MHFEFTKNKSEQKKEEVGMKEGFNRVELRRSQRNINVKLGEGEK
jgi:hypothetical protein